MKNSIFICTKNSSDDSTAQDTFYSLEWRSHFQKKNQTGQVLKQQGHHWGVKSFSPGAVNLKRGKAGQSIIKGGVWLVDDLENNVWYPMSLIKTWSTMALKRMIMIIVKTLKTPDTKNNNVKIIKSINGTIETSFPII
jgi:hypothetical protein